MPKGDRTSPQGQGPKTGTGRGKCSTKGRTLAPQGQDSSGSDRRASRGQGQGASQGTAQGSGRGAGKGRGQHGRRNR